MNNTLLPHDPKWKDHFGQERQKLETILQDAKAKLHHIGSTAIPGIHAKPIIDILGEVTCLTAVEAAQSELLSIGYESLGEYGIAGRRYFRKQSASGRRSHHLHIFESGSPHVMRHLAFRDYLRAHPAIAAEYSALKVGIIAAGDVTWDSYLDAKAPFIAQTEADAVIWYKTHSRQPR